MLLELEVCAVPQLSGEGHNNQERQSLAGALFVQGDHLHRLIDEHE